MTHPNTIPNTANPQKVSPPDRSDRQNREQKKRPDGPPDPVIEKRIERGDDESDDLTS